MRLEESKLGAEDDMSAKKYLVGGGNSTIPGRKRLAMPLVRVCGRSERETESRAEGLMSA